MKVKYYRIIENKNHSFENTFDVFKKDFTGFFWVRLNSDLMTKEDMLKYKETLELNILNCIELILLEDSELK